MGLHVGGDPSRGSIYAGAVSKVPCFLLLPELCPRFGFVRDTHIQKSARILWFILLVLNNADRNSGLPSDS